MRKITLVVLACIIIGQMCCAQAHGYEESEESDESNGGVWIKAPQNNSILFTNMSLRLTVFSMHYGFIRAWGQNQSLIPFCIETPRFIVRQENGTLEVFANGSWVLKLNYTASGIGPEPLFDSPPQTDESHVQIKAVLIGAVLFVAMLFTFIITVSPSAWARVLKIVGK